jgi:hypothetical protein
MRKTIALLAVGLAVSGCVSTMSDEAAQQKMAEALKERSAADIRIERRQFSWPLTYFTVRTTRHGLQDCTFGGGTLDTYGIVYAPICSPATS